MNIMSNTRLFVSYALGRIYGGVIGGVIGVVFLTWLVQTLSQQGVGAQKPPRHNRYYKLTCWKWTRNDYSSIFRCSRMVEYDIFNSDTTS